MYTSSKADYGLVKERIPFGGYVAHDRQPTDMDVLVLPSGQRAVTYTRHGGHGHTPANAEIERIIHKTKYLHVSFNA